MGFRFFRRVQIAPGLRLNLSKSGPSLSMGKRGSWFTVGPRGNRVSAGLPGTGLYYTERVGGRKRRTRSSSRSAPSAAPPQPPLEDRLTLGFFDRLTVPENEKRFVEGCKALLEPNEGEALQHFASVADHDPDAAFLAGFLSLKCGSNADAARHLHYAATHAAQLGTHFRKYGISPDLYLPITGEVGAVVSAEWRGAMLGLVEAYQTLDQREHALRCLDLLREQFPEDVVVLLSEMELLTDEERATEADLQKAVQLSAQTDNETVFHAAVLYYKGVALRRLGLATAARDALTAALRRTKDRPEELLRAARSERAAVYAELGQHSRARQELEKIYAEAPDWGDVAQRLGLRSPT